MAAKKPKQSLTKYAYYKGHKVVGRADLIPAVSQLHGFDADGEPIWTGETTVEWDDQRPETDDEGVTKYVLSNGELITLDECTWRDK